MEKRQTEQGLMNAGREKEDFIVVAGSLNYDIIFKQKRLPKEGETYTADSVSFSGGGKGANQAAQCAKLGIPTYMIGKVGRDSFGQYLTGQLNSYGVCTRGVETVEECTGMAAVHALEDGSVYATIVPGANDRCSVSDIDKWMEVIGKSRILILQLEIPVSVVEELIRRASEAGVYVILNAAPAKPLSKEALKLVDCLVVNEVEASFYAGASVTDEASARTQADNLVSLVKETVIITLGEKGSLLCEKDGARFVGACKAERVAETTGAGDSYIGAFACQKYEGKSNMDACGFAARVSAVTVSGYGAQPSMPWHNQLYSD